MPICEIRKLAFCHIPRTGGVSVSNALSMKVKDKHFKSSYYRENFPGYNLFTIVRPYDERIRSAFGYVIPDIHKHLTLDNLVTSTIKLGAENISLMLRPNEYFLDTEVDFILKFNSLQTDLNAMLNKLGYDPVNLIKCNSFKVWI